MSALRFFSTVALAFFTSTSYGENIAKITFDETQICVPSRFAPGQSEYEIFLEVNVEGLDSSERSHILRIPAQLIKDRVPNYTLSHINRHKVDLEHAISGIAYNMSGISDLDYLPTMAWSAHSLEEPPLIELDESGFYRIYRGPEKSFSWHLVEYPPPKTPTTTIPNGWYIGYCGNTMEKCSQHVIVKDIFYQYKLHLIDLPVHRQVASALKSLFMEWESTCRNET
jgi:hypothetical protein